MAIEMFTDRVGYIKSLDDIETAHFEIFTNIGLIMSEHGAILIDTGWGEKQGKAILSELARIGKKPVAIINTHAHLDHAGANKYISDRTGCPIYCTMFESLFLRGADNMFHVLFSEMVLPLKNGLEEYGRLEKTEPVIIEGDSHITIDGVQLYTVSLPGHSDGHIGVICDDVFFTGDALLDPEAMKKNKAMYMTSPADMRRSVERIMATDCIKYIPAHGPAFDDARLSGEYYFKMMERIKKSMADAASEPVCFEELMRRVAERVRLHVEALPYYSTVRVMLHSLANALVLDGSFECFVKEGMLYYKLKDGDALEAF